LERLEPHHRGSGRSLQSLLWHEEWTGWTGDAGWKCLLHDRRRQARYGGWSLEKLRVHFGELTPVGEGSVEQVREAQRQEFNAFEGCARYWIGGTSVWWLATCADGRAVVEILKGG
jgi:hypothetical protein